jgi:hypothetical protein
LVSGSVFIFGWSFRSPWFARSGLRFISCEPDSWIFVLRAEVSARIPFSRASVARVSRLDVRSPRVVSRSQIRGVFGLAPGNFFSRSAPKCSLPARCSCFLRLWVQILPGCRSRPSARKFVEFLVWHPAIFSRVERPSAHFPLGVPAFFGFGFRFCLGVGLVPRWQSPGCLYPSCLRLCSFGFEPPVYLATASNFCQRDLVSVGRLQNSFISAVSGSLLPGSSIPGSSVCVGCSLGWPCCRSVSFLISALVLLGLHEGGFFSARPVIQIFAGESRYCS